MNLRWSSHVAPKPPEGGGAAVKRKTANFRLHFAWRKSDTKFLCLKTVSGKVVKPNYLCKNDWCGRTLVPEFLDQTDRVGAKSPIFDLFSLVATQP